MAETKVRRPDGQIVTVRHPDGASEQDIIAFAQKNLSSTPEELALEQPEPKAPATMFEKALGIGEAALSLGTGMAASALTAPIGGVAAGIDLAKRKIQGEDTPSPSQEIVDKYSLHGYTPRTDEGKRVLSNFQKPFTTFDQFMYGLGAKAQDLGAPPSVAAAIKTAPDIALMASGAKTAVSPMKRAADVAKAEGRAGSIGLDLGADTNKQVQQLQGAAEGFSPAINPSEGMQNIPAAVMQQRAIQANKIGQQYQQAEQMGAQVPSKTAGSLADELKSSVSPFITEDMKSVNGLLNEAQKFGLPAQQSVGEALGVKGAATIPVNDIFKFRQKINANLPSDYRSPEYAALSTMKKTVDGFLNDALTNDMVSGNPAAIAKWREATTNWKDFKETFDSNQVIKKLQDENATPEQVKNMIFGMSAISAPRQTGQVISKLKTILGPGSDEFKTLQKSVLTDVLDPMLSADPDFGKFVANYDKFKRNNPTMIKQLFDSDTLDKLDSLRDFSRAVARAPDMSTDVLENMRGKGLANTLSVLTVGSGLSRKALEVNFMRRLLRTTEPGKGPAHKNAILAEVLGYDPKAPLISMQPIGMEAAAQTARTPPTDPAQLAQFFQGGQ